VQLAWSHDGSFLFLSITLLLNVTATVWQGHLLTCCYLSSASDQVSGDLAVVVVVQKSLADPNLLQFLWWQ
jgi:hypothetical protein